MKFLEQQKLTSKQKAILYIFLTIVVPLLTGIGFLEVLGKIDIRYNGFAIDHEERLYVSKSRRIDVYQDGVFIDTVFKTPRGYRFTIHDKKLYVNFGSKIQIMDLSGNLIEEIDGNTLSSEERQFIGKEWSKLHKQRNTFTKNGVEYRATDKWWLYQIEKVIEGDSSENEIIYQMPNFDYICKVIDKLLRPSLFVFPLIFLFYVAKDNKRRALEKMSGS